MQAKIKITKRSRISYTDAVNQATNAMNEKYKVANIAEYKVTDMRIDNKGQENQQFVITLQIRLKNN